MSGGRTGIGVVNRSARPLQIADVGHGGAPGTGFRGNVPFSEFYLDAIQNAARSRSWFRVPAGAHRGMWISGAQPGRGGAHWRPSAEPSKEAL